MGSRSRLYEIVFEADTPAGRVFDLALIISVLISVFAVMLGSVAAIEARYSGLLRIVEWFFTILFTIEYLLRLCIVRQPSKYAASFFGLIDLLAVLPTYIGLILPGSHYSLTIRILRVLRIFRVLKLAAYITEVNQLLAVLRASRRRILVFLLTVLTVVVMLGALMYIIEGQETGFTSIPRSIYWAIVTLTTVGYGDISPKTNLGQALAAAIMILGYSLIVVPTGFVSIAMYSQMKREGPTRACPSCGKKGHEDDALFCRFCGKEL